MCGEIDADILQVTIGFKIRQAAGTAILGIDTEVRVHVVVIGVGGKDTRSHGQVRHGLPAITGRCLDQCAIVLVGYIGQHLQAQQEFVDTDPAERAGFESIVDILHVIDTVIVNVVTTKVIF